MRMCLRGITNLTQHTEHYYLFSRNSLSMAAKVPRFVDDSKDHNKQGKNRTEIVKAPGALVISSYVTCPDITLTVTPGMYDV